MNNSTKKRFFTIAVILLIVLNISAIGIFWFNKRDNHFPPPPPKGGNAADFLIKELVLDSLQQINYLQLKQAHRKKADSIQRNIRTAKDSLFNFLKQPNSNSVLIEQALAKIGAEQMNFERSVFEHFKQLRSICNAQQQLKFDSVIQQALQMMAQGKGRPPMPPPNEKLENEKRRRSTPESNEDQRYFNPPPRDDFDGPPPPPPPNKDGRRFGPPRDKDGKPMHPPRDGNHRRPPPPPMERDSMG